MTNRFHKITHHDSRARLVSPELNIDAEGCLYMWYFNDNRTTREERNTLNVFRSHLTGSVSLLFRLQIHKNLAYCLNQLIEVLQGGRYCLILEAVYGNEYGEEDYVGLDNIEIYNRFCS